ncbi:MAG: ATP-grasp domain-containing protein [Candidatus Omnitrophica bacterium]|nr:ATP-grasp domain-containing protein [Candidatus Omnitrophota bacterium]
MKKCIRTIGITFNLKREKLSDDRQEEYDEIETVEALKAEIESYGFKVILLEQRDAFLKDLLKSKPDFVLNIAEGRSNTRSRESEIPSILESLNIPYSGSDPISLGITLDKYLTNIILNAKGVPVPFMFMVKNSEEISFLKHIFKNIDYFIVKPRWEGSSKGIFLNSIVSDLKQLKKRIRFITSRYSQPALVEEFLPGDEFTVGVLGNGERIRILGMMKISYRRQLSKFFIYSLEVKREWQKNVRYEPEDKIPFDIRKNLEKYALEAFRILELRDIARIDMRLDSNGLPKIIDINPLPGLSPLYSDLPILYKLKGGSYSGLIKVILEEAFLRYGFKIKLIKRK